MYRKCVVLKLIVKGSEANNNFALKIKLPSDRSEWLKVLIFREYSIKDIDIISDSVYF